MTVALLEPARSAGSEVSWRNEVPGRSRVVSLPDVRHRRTYATRHLVATARNIAKRHRLVLGRPLPIFEAGFSISPAQRAEWRDQFALPGADRDRAVPFTFHTVAGSLLLMGLLQELGVNFRHVRHVRSEMTFPHRGGVVEPGVPHRLGLALADVVDAGKGRVVLLIDVEVLGLDGRLVQRAREFFMVLNLGRRWLPEAAGPKALRLHESLKLAPPLRGDRRCVPVSVPLDAGRRFGRISGDLNLVHTRPGVARLFGHHRAFVQGLCIANQVVAHLADQCIDDLEELTISYVRPVFVGQSVDFLYQHGRFEVRDGRRKLLAFGLYR